MSLGDVGPMRDMASLLRGPSEEVTASMVNLVPPVTAPVIAPGITPDATGHNCSCGSDAGLGPYRTRRVDAVRRRQLTAPDWGGTYEGSGG